MPRRHLLSPFVFVVASMAVASCSPAAPPPSAPAPAASAPVAVAADLKAVAKTMVASAMIKEGDKVVISGSMRDHALLEDLAIETMKAGGEPLLTMGSQELGRRSYDEVPEKFDSQVPAFQVALASLQDVQLAIDIGDSDSSMAGVPAARVAARAKAALPVGQASLKKNVRLVNLGNGLYPTKALAERLGKSEAEVATAFWKAVTVAPESLRAKGEALRSALRAGKDVMLTSANGTHLMFTVAMDRGFLSDGAISPEEVTQGNAATQTWLPAGELLVPVVPGTAEGQVVIDKLLFQGTMIEGLTLTFSKGKLTAMTAKSGLDPLKARYDAAGGGKDVFSYIDIGLNPEAVLPTTTGRTIWVAPGNVTIGLGDNTFWGGTNTSDFGLSGVVGAPTLAAGGKTLVEAGTLK